MSYQFGYRFTSFRLKNYFLSSKTNMAMICISLIFLSININLLSELFIKIPYDPKWTILLHQK